MSAYIYIYLFIIYLYLVLSKYRCWQIKLVTVLRIHYERLLESMGATDRFQKIPKVVYNVCKGLVR